MKLHALWNTPDLVPKVVYSDVPLAVEWLERVFGFKERADARLTWEGGARTWMEVGNGLFSIATPDETWHQSVSATSTGVMIKVYVDDVDKHFSRAKTEGATIILEPRDEFWGGRIYRALDHEGRQWEISQRGRDLAADQWKLPPGIKLGVDK